MWDDPIRDPWALSAVLLIGLALFGPTAFLIGGDMFRRRKQETAMADDENGGLVSAWLDDQKEASAEMPVRRRTWADDERPAPALGRAGVPEPMIGQIRIVCEHCGGRGFTPGVNDLLKDSVKLLADNGDEVIRLFYSSLLRAHPQLMTLFPGDPTKGDFGSDHKGAVQRDRLLKALTALAGLYNPDDPESMASLDQALGSYGRAHASFVRQDGTVKGATLEEYAAVKEALFSTLITSAAGKWRPEYTAAWNQAYDYAAAAMIVEQFRSGFSAPRFPRPGR